MRGRAQGTGGNAGAAGRRWRWRWALLRAAMAEPSLAQLRRGPWGRRSCRQRTAVTRARGLNFYVAPGAAAAGSEPNPYSPMAGA
ncbi:MAG: hypothetical protein EBU30_05120 [Synechococcaceae bacterium WB6_3B_236]|nr:hypothetical protein [Synechococcaceae bacterium WB6_3B_236]